MLTIARSCTIQCTPPLPPVLAALSSSWDWWPCRPHLSQVWGAQQLRYRLACSGRCAARCKAPHPMPALYPACAEYCSRGSLYDCLATAHDNPAAAAQLTWHRRLSMAVDGGTGLLYLHRRNIIHRDGEAVCMACAGVKCLHCSCDQRLHHTVVGCQPSLLCSLSNPSMLQ